MHVWKSTATNWGGVKVTLPKEGGVYAIETPDTFPNTFGSILRLYLRGSYGRHGHTLSDRPAAEDLNEALVTDPRFKDLKFELDEDSSDEIEFSKVPDLAVS